MKSIKLELKKPPRSGLVQQRVCDIGETMHVVTRRRKPSERYMSLRYRSGI